ncbi:hypothetical protein HPB48_019326 [Haemaphysalis longicornis]|uniref:Transposase n=1 Tax=Haemaphysalis longicornis TaxID=44386 RepID=A0A9J6GVD6_HAELO|nr:hypothetical protein HPB48_019326 [Haemaphysalis longicornis]
MCTPVPGWRFPAKSVQEVLNVVSEDTRVSPRTVAKLKAECLSGNLVSPKRRPRDVTISSAQTVKHDSCTIHAVCLKVQSIYVKREIPTLGSVRKAVNEDDGLLNFTKTTLWRLMKDMGFTYDKRIRNLGIIVWRPQVPAGDQGIPKTEQGGIVDELPRNVCSVSGGFVHEGQLAELQRGHISMPPARAASC